MKILIKSFLTGFIISVLFSMVGFSNVCEELEEDVLRVHILANSDSEEDQNLKLQVRDEFLIYTEKYLNNLDKKKTAISVILENKYNICNYLENFVLEQGYNYKINLIYTNMYFETRTYQRNSNTVTLPAGYYDTIRITIGEGSGKNWWCVMFPQLCLPSAENLINAQDILTEKETDVIQNQVEYKFKIVELFYDARNWFKRLF